MTGTPCARRGGTSGCTRSRSGAGTAGGEGGGETRGGEGAGKGGARRRSEQNERCFFFEVPRAHLHDNHGAVQHAETNRARELRVDRADAPLDPLVVRDLPQRGRRGEGGWVPFEVAPSGTSGATAERGRVGGATRRDGARIHLLARLSMDVVERQPVDLHRLLPLAVLIHHHRHPDCLALRAGRGV